jgi:hypothetical protein
MLNQEDSRRLAQLERQLRRDDPEFCARMVAGQPEATIRKRPSLSLVLTSVVIWIAALVLGVLGWWVAAAISALWATVVLAAVAFRFARHRGHPRDHT